MRVINKLLAAMVGALFIMTTTIYAATPTFSTQLTADKTSVTRSSEITVTLKLKDFANMGDGLYACFAELEYDKNYFEELTATSLKGAGTWSTPTFNPANNQLTTDSGTGVKTESEVFTVTFKVKADAPIGTTNIRVKNFQASEGDADLNANNDATITVRVVEENTTNDDNNNNGQNNNTNDNNSNNNGQNNNTNDNNSNNNGQNNNTNDNNSNNNGQNNNTNNNNSNNNAQNNNASAQDNTQSTNKLPQTGENVVIFAGILIVIVAGVIAYLKYQKYRGIK